MEGRHHRVMASPPASRAPCARASARVARRDLSVPTIRSAPSAPRKARYAPSGITIPAAPASEQNPRPHRHQQTVARRFRLPGGKQQIGQHKQHRRRGQIADVAQRAARNAPTRRTAGLSALSRSRAAPLGPPVWAIQCRGSCRAPGPCSARKPSTSAPRFCSTTSGTRGDRIDLESALDDVPAHQALGVGIDAPTAWAITRGPLDAARCAPA